MPIAFTGNNGPVRRLDQTGENEGVPVTEFRIVMDQYFETMGIPMIAGRVLDDRDQAGTTAVAVINETLAKRLFPTLDPPAVVGQSLRIGWLNGPASQIVGVAANVRSRRPDAPPDPEVYVPFAQNPSPSMTSRCAAGDPRPVQSIQSAMAQSRRMSRCRRCGRSMKSWRRRRAPGLLSWLSVLFGILPRCSRSSHLQRDVVPPQRER